MVLTADGAMALQGAGLKGTIPGEAAEGVEIHSSAGRVTETSCAYASTGRHLRGADGKENSPHLAGGGGVDEAVRLPKQA